MAAAQPRRSVPIRQQPKVAAPSYWRYDRCGKLRSCDWNLIDRTGRGGKTLRETTEAGYPIAIMRNGVNARIVSESALHQNLECPQRLCGDGVTRRAVNNWPNAAGIFDGAYGPFRVGLELGWSQVVDELVRIAVTADFVARMNNLSY